MMTLEQRDRARIIIRSSRIGMIVCEIAKQLGIMPIEAMRLFYRSNTCRDFHNRATGMYLQGDLYVVAVFMDELKNIM